LLAHEQKKAFLPILMFSDTSTPGASALNVCA